MSLLARSICLQGWKAKAWPGSNIICLYPDRRKFRTFFFATFLPTSQKRKKINCFCSTIFRVLTQTLGRSLISPAFSHYAHQTSDPYFLPAINLNATKYSDQKLFWDRRSSSLAFRYPGCCRLCHCLHLPLRLCCSIRDPSGRSRRHTLL